VEGAKEADWEGRCWVSVMQLIESHIAAVLTVSTMGCAAIGNLISDVAGLRFLLLPRPAHSTLYCRVRRAHAKDTRAGAVAWWVQGAAGTPTRASMQPHQARASFARARHTQHPLVAMGWRGNCSAVAWWRVMKKTGCKRLVARVAWSGAASRACDVEKV